MLSIWTAAACCCVDAEHWGITRWHFSGEKGGARCNKWIRECIKVTKVIEYVRRSTLNINLNRAQRYIDLDYITSSRMTLLRQLRPNKH